jgi:hypothetical protein
MNDNKQDWCYLFDSNHTGSYKGGAGILPGHSVKVGDDVYFVLAITSKKEGVALAQKTKDDTAKAYFRIEQADIVGLDDEKEVLLVRSFRTCSELLTTPHTFDTSTHTSGHGICELVLLRETSLIAPDSVESIVDVVHYEWLGDRGGCLTGMRPLAQVGGYLGEDNTAYLQRIDQQRWEQCSRLSPSFRARVRMSRILTVAVSQGKAESKGEQNALVGDEATMLFNMMQNGDGYKKVAVKNNLVSRVA